MDEHRMDDQFAAGRDFIWRQGRLLERRLFATCFEGAPAKGVVDAVTAYRNDDGGFGHGLEPDIRCPASLPVYVDVAMQALATVEAVEAVEAVDAVDAVNAANAVDRGLVLAACEYLAKVAAAAGRNGAVAPASPVIEGYPRAVHWTDWTYEPSLNPTAGLAGHLKQLGVEHPWVDEATAYCWAQLDAPELPTDAHALSAVFVFLEQAPAGERTSLAAARVADSLAGASSWRADPDDPDYGLTPLTIAPLAGSRWRQLFPDAVLAAHLDRLQRDQQPDGGWPITWEPPSEAAVLEWRGIVTLAALRTLVSYGRLTAGR